MCSTYTATRKPNSNRLLQVLTHGRRRQVLSVLTEDGSPLSETELADRIAASSGDGRRREDGEVDAPTVRIDLRHVHLPKLAAIGLVTWDWNAETVAASDHPLFRKAAFRALVERPRDGQDALIDAVANDRRRAVLDVLGSRKEPATRWDLAGEVLARETDGEPAQDAIESMIVQLHHVHLPKLDAVELIQYDDEHETIELRDTAQVSRLESLAQIE